MMTRLKKTIFSIFGMAFIATGFVACSGDDVTTELDGIKDKFLVLEKGSYNYDAHIGEYGGYSIRIELLW